MWVAMERYGYAQLPEELNGSKNHRLENVMTLSPQALADFGRLGAWLVETVRQT